MPAYQFYLITVRLIAAFWSSSIWVISDLTDIQYHSGHFDEYFCWSEYQIPLLHLYVTMEKEDQPRQGKILLL